MSARDWKRNQLTIALAVSSAGKVKSTKTRRERTFHIDVETTAMLRRHCDQLNETAASAGVDLAAEAFLFSLEQNCTTPMPPDHLTKRVAVLEGCRVTSGLRTSILMWSPSKTSRCDFGDPLPHLGQPESLDHYRPAACRIEISQREVGELGGGGRR
jgi:hypothetical protein